MNITSLIESDVLKSTEIKAIRIAKNSKGISKGFAYIECQTMQGVKDIIKEINDKIIGDHKLFAALSEPPKKNF